jgi:hypothetical protein
MGGNGNFSVAKISELAFKIGDRQKIVHGYGWANVDI